MAAAKAAQVAVSHLRECLFGTRYLTTAMASNITELAEQVYGLIHLVEKMQDPPFGEDSKEEGRV